LGEQVLAKPQHGNAQLYRIVERTNAA